MGRLHSIGFERLVRLRGATENTQLQLHPSVTMTRSGGVIRESAAEGILFCFIRLYWQVYRKNLKTPGPGRHSLPCGTGQMDPVRR